MEDLLERLAGPSEVKEYIIDSNKAVHFISVRCAEDIDKGEYFHPEMTHQIFGEGEQIYGYKELVINFYFSAAKLNMYVEFNHSGLLRNNDIDDSKPDEIMEPILNLVPPNTIMDNKDCFVALLRKEQNFLPFGTQISRYTVDVDNKERTFEIYTATANSAGFVEYFERVQMFSMFFIDAASYLDHSDPKWKYFMIFERYYTSAGSPMYALVGYLTLYEFYAYPDKIRPRISQLLILPPFQKLGLGTKLLSTVYERYIVNPKVFTISVEDPSATFSHIRLLVDCQNCLKLPEFSPAGIKNGFTKEHYKVAEQKLKLNKHNATKVFNTIYLRLVRANSVVDDKKYEVYLKDQIYEPFRRQDKEVQKLIKMKLSTDQINSLMSIVPKLRRDQLVHDEYLERKRRYQKVVDRLEPLTDQELVCLMA